MASKTEICNLALSHLGSGTEISSITERSSEAAALRRYYDVARDAVLRDFPWSFATRIGILGLLEINPTTEWGYSYQYPVDCLNLKRVLSGSRMDSYSSRINYKVLKTGSGLAIYSDQPLAEIEYTARIDDESVYPPDFILALSFRLAAYIAPRITGGDPFKMADRAMQLYLLEVSRAKASSANEESAGPELESEFIRVRD